MKFDIGDKVRVYGGIPNDPEGHYLLGAKGTIAANPDREFPDCVFVKFEDIQWKGPEND